MEALAYTVPVAAASLQTDLDRVRRRIADAARCAGRDPAAVELLAVTKAVGAPMALALCRLGQLDLGENRLEGLAEKARYLAQAGVRPRWHFIGHLQRNKARRVVALADVIHSVDSLRLLETIARVAADQGRRPAIYLELRSSEAEGRHGFAAAELAEAALRAGALEHVDLLGLMNIAPLPTSGDGGDAARESFEALAELAAGLEAEPPTAACFPNGRVRLSMGMSADLELAVAAGSHLVRVGSALFEGSEEVAR
ncbi:MAG: YggS family pyridoxal phosphate-dependent enzyme [Planctomycetota bacterium]|jgi:hypothetical protein|nr:YggS family pyridoxal phosphate-dependent enzyme [Planctomycetota bacterium]MDP6762941.1 YggS family pyridoxal phosphate-dependent enzyme [Planctomycetota bacterium]MDP6987879.1 YggS family pyridoxal phosphate-dependent enzyme [Planctomycetota bacterium]